MAESIAHPATAASLDTLHVITGLTTGGAEMTLARLVERMRRDGWRSGVVSLRDRGTVGSIIAGSGTRVRALGLLNARRLPGAALRLIHESVAGAPRLVQGWLYHGNLAASLAARAAGRRTGRRVPVAWNIRNPIYALSDEKPATGRLVRLGARLSRGADAVVYNSRVSARQHEALGYAAERTVVIPNGFDLGTFRPDAEARARVRRAWDAADDVVVVGHAARVHPVKDHATFLRAAAEVCRADPTVRVVLAGRGTDTDPALGRLCAELGIANVVRRLGDVRDTPALMAAVDILCCSSFSEAFPNSVGEAMAAGTPVVVTDVGDCAWLAGPDSAAVPPRDAPALAAAIRELVGRPASERRALGNVARRRIGAQFSIDAMARRYASLYRDLLATGRPAAARAA